MKVNSHAVSAAALAMLVALGLAGCSWLFPPDIPDVPNVGFAPTASAVHTLITIVGEGFGDPLPGVAVTFDGVAATIVTWSDTNIAVRIPVLATPTGSRQAQVEVRRAGALIGSGTYTILRGILFETERDGNGEIYVMNPDGTQPTNLTSHAALDKAASWSPDGTKIVFETTRDGNLEIYVMGADGSSPTNLSDDSDADYYPVWSPDGTKIAFMTDRESSGLPPILDADPRIVIPMLDVEIYVMNADGTGQTNVTDNFAWDGLPSWSPNSQRIAFETNRDDGPIILDIVPMDLGYEIYAVDIDGTDLARLSSSPEDDRYPAWSPDGTKIAFQSRRDGNEEIYVMNADGTGQLRLTNDADADILPSWSPSGNWITFHSYRDGNAEIYRTSPTGTTMRLTNDLGIDWAPSWSPDGSQIAFLSDRSGSLDVYRMNADGSLPVRLTTDPDIDANPYWDTFGGSLGP